MNQIPWYLGLPAATRRVLHRFMRIHDYRKDRRLYYQDDHVEAVFLVLEGPARCIRWRDDGTTFLLSSYGPGQWLGLPEAFSGGSYLSDGITSKDARIGSFSLSDFSHLMEMPGFMLMVLKEVATGYYPLLDLIDNHSAEFRIARFLLSQWRAGEGAHNIDITQHEIADRTGLSRETVNKQLQMMQVRGLIRKERGRLIIENPHAFE